MRCIGDTSMVYVCFHLTFTTIPSQHISINSCGFFVKLTNLLHWMLFTGNFFFLEITVNLDIEVTNLFFVHENIFLGVKLKKSDSLEKFQTSKFSGRLEL